MINPVTTQYGDTYEKENLFNILNGNDFYDPIKKYYIK